MFVNNIESIPTTLRSALFPLVLVFSLAYVGIKNAGLLKFSIDPGTYTVAGVEQTRLKLSALIANSAAVPGHRLQYSSSIGGS